MASDRKVKADMPCRFLGLPAELRNAVYEELVGGSYLVQVSKPYRHKTLRLRSFDKCRGSTQKFPSILRVSKQIHQEALPILYSTKLWRFDAGTDMIMFSEQHKTSLPYIRKISLSKWSLVFAQTLNNKLVNAHRDRQVKAVFWPRDYHTFTDMAERLYKPTKLFLSGRKDKAARRKRFDMLQIECGPVRASFHGEEENTRVEMTTRLRDKIEELLISDGVLEPQVEEA